MGRVVWRDMRRVMWGMECKWIHAMEKVITPVPWSGNAQHLMFLMFAFGFTCLAKIKVWAHHTFEANSKNVLLTAITNHTRMSWARLFCTDAFPCKKELRSREQLSLDSVGQKLQDNK